MIHSTMCVHSDAPLDRAQQPPRAVVLVTVVDRDERFVLQAARLLLSLRWFGGTLAHAAFVLCSIGELDREWVSFFRRHGASVHCCSPFDPSQPNITSNKLRGLEAPGLDQFEQIVLIDCDTLIVQDSSRFCVVDGVGIKIADHATVSDEKLRRALEALGIPVPERTFDYDLVDAKTFGYFNSGVVIVARDWLRPLSDRWSESCRRLLELEQTLELPAHFVEQSALCATVAGLDIPLTILPASMNLPVHLGARGYVRSYASIDPQIIHYHWLSDDQGYVTSVPLKMAQLRIDCFNARLRAEMQAGNGSGERWGWGLGNTGSAKPRPKVIVGTGWWCDDRPHEWALGDDRTRATSFFALWYRQVVRYLSPERIVVTDSHSPLKPDWRSHENVHWIELDKNYGSPNHVRVGLVDTKLSGFTKSVINGAMYAYCCDADYYVYVEQDCLIRGDDFLDHAMGESEAEIFLGRRNEGGQGIEGRPAAPMIQQSCIIVRKSGLERFIAGVMEGAETDGELSPEVKMERDLVPWEFLAVPYGRSRPIDFSETHFYAQHLTAEELEAFIELEGLHLPEESARSNLLRV